MTTTATKNVTETSRTTASRITDMEKIREIALEHIPCERTWMGEEFTTTRRIVNDTNYPVRIFEIFDGLFGSEIRADRLRLLIDMKDALSVLDLSHVMRYFWTTYSSIVGRVHGPDIKAVLRILRDCEPLNFMSTPSYDTYKVLPDELTIYRRAFTEDNRCRKFFPWTCDLKQVLRKDFSPRFGSYNASWILISKIKKKDVLAYFRQDSEVIVNPNKVFDTRWCPTGLYSRVDDALNELKNSYSKEAVEAIYARVLGYSHEIEDMESAVKVTRDILKESCCVPTAKLIGKYQADLPMGNSLYYEERLYQQNTGEYFLVGNGGAMSKYHFITCWGHPKGCQRSIPITRSEANIWISTHLDS